MVTEHCCLFLATWSIYVLQLLELWSSLVHNVLTHYNTGCCAGAGWTAQQRLARAHVCSTEYSALCKVKCTGQCIMLLCQETSRKIIQDTSDHFAFIQRLNWNILSFLCMPFKYLMDLLGRKLAFMSPIKWLLCHSLLWFMGVLFVE